jgi:hypothetical protein
MMSIDDLTLRSELKQSAIFHIDDALIELQQMGEGRDDHLHAQVAIAQALVALAMLSLWEKT